MSIIAYYIDNIIICFVIWFCVYSLCIFSLFIFIHILVSHWWLLTIWRASLMSVNLLFWQPVTVLTNCETVAYFGFIYCALLTNKLIDWLIDWLTVNILKLTTLANSPYTSELSSTPFILTPWILMRPETLVTSKASLTAYTSACVCVVVAEAATSRILVIMAASLAAYSAIIVVLLCVICVRGVRRTGTGKRLCWIINDLPLYLYFLKMFFTFLFMCSW